MTQPEPTERIVAPLTGMLVPLADVPDQVFASKKMGDGFAVDPTDGTVVAPATGTVMMVAKTGHAFAIKTAEGVEVLVHMGIDTVELAGKPFALTLAKGDAVEAGQPVGTMDLAQVAAAGKAAMTMVIFTNLARRRGTLDVRSGAVTAGDAAATVTLPAPDAQPATGAAEVAALDAAPAAAATAAVSLEAPANLTGFDKLAYQIVEGVGGEDNIRSFLHCITRVRFYLKDESLAQDKAIADLDGVVDVIKATSSASRSRFPRATRTPTRSSRSSWPPGWPPASSPS
jgi:PTS system beta-glucosides-specific IIC component